MLTNKRDMVFGEKNNVDISKIIPTGGFEYRKFLSHVTAQLNKSKAPRHTRAAEAQPNHSTEG